MLRSLGKQPLGPADRRQSGDWGRSRKFQVLGAKGTGLKQAEKLPDEDLSAEHGGDRGRLAWAAFCRAFCSP